MEDSNTLTIALSAAIGAVVSYLGALFKSSLDRRRKLDEDLRENRSEVYKELWTETALLPKWPKNENITYGELEVASESFRKWYFEKGGIYLSYQARKMYGKTQESFEKVLNTRSRQKSKIIKECEYELLQKSCSTLRTELTKDLLSRKRYWV